MRIDGRVRIAALGTCVPQTTQTTRDALATGIFTESDAVASGYLELPVSNTLAPPQLAALAASSALDRAGERGAEVDLLVHAWTHYQGHEFWSPAHFIAAQIGAEHAEPVGLQQMCNGGAAAVSTAVSRLLADSDVRCAVVTTADCFAQPGFDRWRGDYGVIYGDAGTAAVLSDADAQAQFELLALTTVAAPDLERMHRGDDPFHVAGSGITIDVRRTKKAFLAAVGKKAFGKTVAARVADVLAAGIAEAGIAPSDPRLVLLPRLGAAGLNDIYRPAVAEALAAPAVDLGQRTGHLGAGDLLANLASVIDGDLVPPGDVVVALSAGAGFTWSCLVARRLNSNERSYRNERTQP